MEIQGYNLPDELYYEPNHTWARVEGDAVVIGLNDFAQKLAGEFVSIDLPSPGKKVQQGKPVGSVESGKWVGRVYAPVSGEVLEVNETLEDDPTLMNSDPYGEGWVAKIKVDNPAELESLLKGEKVVKWIEEEIQKHAKK